MDRKLSTIDRILIVGLGSIGRRHLILAREFFPQADIRILRHQSCDEIPEAANGCFYDLMHASAFGPQVTVIANPAPFHLKVARIMAEQGSHLLIEKPISHDVHGVNDILRMVTEHGIVASVGYNLRYHKSLLFFREMIHDGVIGKITSVRCEIGQYLPSWRPGTDYRTGVSARSDLGGGVLLELSHEFDYLRWVFGEIESVMAWLDKVSNLEIDVEDVAHLVMRFQSKEDSPLIASLNMDFIRHDTTRTCVAIGEIGTLKWDAVSGQVQSWNAGDEGWCKLFECKHHRDDTYREEWENFINSIECGSLPCVTLEDGLAVLEIIQAAKCSFQAQGRFVSVDNSVK